MKKEELTPLIQEITELKKLCNSVDTWGIDKLASSVEKVTQLYGTEKQMLVSKQFSYHLFYFNSISTTRDKVKSTITGRITSILCNNYTMSVGSTFRAIKTNLKTGKSDGIVTYYCNTISKKNKQFFINISKQKTK